MHCNLSLSVEQQIQNDLRKFWELEQTECLPGILSEEEIAYENHFKKHFKRNDNGAFVVKLSLKMDIDKLGSSLYEAKKRLLDLERRLNNNDAYEKLYSDFIDEYIQLGHMSKVSKSESDTYSDYYMSHHGVYREDAITTSLKVIFDASLPSCTGFSLNNILMIGPTTQQDLFSILVRFRQHSIVIAADCTKMYRSVLVAPEDRHLQKILWRFSDNEPIDTYQLNTLTYGTAPASFLAIRCLFEINNNVQTEYPDIVDIIKNDCYVDDSLIGADSVREARRVTELVLRY
ncbi:uncharacterized protein LOC130904152 [Diorhabda carinulata]|uniref:uncharacterized protein LOC130904152 n=1 Tax=Diorhabda carinulata TaxID=1163345 RepID=UPI0025A0B8BA|nr:uncharacterized protein LOC130904152 [Diorhabda carinulata]